MLSFLKGLHLLTYLTHGSPAQTDLCSRKVGTFASREDTVPSEAARISPVSPPAEYTIACLLRKVSLVTSRRCVPIHVQNKARSICKMKQDISLWTSAARAQKAVSKGKVKPESFFQNTGMYGRSSFHLPTLLFQTKTHQ